VKILPRSQESISAGDKDNVSDDVACRNEHEQS
jgi:hypothetical protein